MEERNISGQTLQRLPLYVNYLKSLPGGTSHISATSIAEGLSLNSVQVRKDLAAVSSGGRPKVGYQTQRLIGDIQAFLGTGGGSGVIIVGMGRLGRALTQYKGFLEYGQTVVAVFDRDKSLVGRECDGRVIRPMTELPALCRRLGVRIGILTVPADSAQEVSALLVDSGVKAIWNFAPTHLAVPDGVLVRNENLAVSLAILSRQAGITRDEGGASQ